MFSIGTNVSISRYPLCKQLSQFCHEFMKIKFRVEIRHLLIRSTERNSSTEIPSYVHSCNEQALEVALKYMAVHEDFITEREEESLLAELEPYLKRLRYEVSHWDDAIHGYRETEKATWNMENSAILQKVRDLAFSGDTRHLRHIHVLDVSKEGYIKPHVDSIRFCGDTIAGLSLVSSSVMRLVHEVEKAKSVDVLLKRRSLYIMKGDIRYKYTHEILPDNLSIFKETRIARARRISVICRNESDDDNDCIV